MNPLVRLETWCADVVERGFARLFPSVLEPAVVARRLAATIEGAVSRAEEEPPALYRVRLSPHDFARVETERELLERQWSKMAVALWGRAGRAAASPAVQVAADDGVPEGAIAIDLERRPVAPPAAPLVLRTEGAGPAFPLTGSGQRESMTIGRDAACELVVADPRVSRRHARLWVRGGAVEVEDLGSTNGTHINGVRVGRGALSVGDRLGIGDTTLVLDAG
jgi:hypothetical protein